MSETLHTSCHCHGEARSGRAAWMEMVTLLALATFLAYSYFAGRLTAFLAPGYVWLTPAAAAMLYAMLLARVVAYASRRGQARAEACHPVADEHHAHGEHHHGLHVPPAACMVVLLTPIVMALWLNPQQLSAEGARKRRIPTPPRNVKLERAFAWVLGEAAAEETAADQAAPLPKSPTVLDLLGAVEEGRGEAIEGQFVTMTGQCDLRGASGEGSAERFDLYRLVINCCIADATSVSVEVAPPAGVRLDSGGWIRVGGLIKFDNPQDPAMPVVHAATISRIPEPSKPYL